MPKLTNGGVKVNFERKVSSICKYSERDKTEWEN